MWTRNLAFINIYHDSPPRPAKGKTIFFERQNLAKRDTRKHYRLRHRSEAREKGLCVVFASGNDEKILINSRTHTHKFHRKKFVCVSTCMRRESDWGHRHTTSEGRTLFRARGTRSSCATSTHVFITNSGSSSGSSMVRECL